MIDLAKLPYIQATKYKRYDKPGPRPVRWIVIHTAECPCRTGSARNVANYFAHGSEGRDASAHYVVGPEETIHCVQNNDIAFGAKGANTAGIHVELTAYAKWDANDWKTWSALQMLERAQELVATLCKAYSIPVEWKAPCELDMPGEKGITGHAEVSKAFGGTHTDPGEGFPATAFLAGVLKALNAG